MCPTASVDGQPMVKEPETPGSTTSKEQLEDLEQVLIMDSIKDAINKEQKQKVYGVPKTHAERDAKMVSPTLYVSVEEPEVSSPMMNYRNPTAMLSPQEQTNEMSPVQCNFSMHREEGQPVDVHWTQLNVQPPGSTTYEGSGRNSIAVEMLDKIYAQRISDKDAMPAVNDEIQGGENLFGNEKMRGMRRLANAYINKLAKNKVNRMIHRDRYFC